MSRIVYNPFELTPRETELILPLVTADLFGSREYHQYPFIKEQDRLPLETVVRYFDAWPQKNGSRAQSKKTRVYLGGSSVRNWIGEGIKDYNDLDVLCVVPQKRIEDNYKAKKIKKIGANGGIFQIPRKIDGKIVKENFAINEKPAYVSDMSYMGGHFETELTLHYQPLEERIRKTYSPIHVVFVTRNNF